MQPTVMLKLQIFKALFVFFILLTVGTLFAQQDSVLVFSKTKGFRHQNITKGVKTIIDLGKENNFIVTATEDASLFTTESLGKYKVVIFLNTTGDILGLEAQAAFENYISQGGGFVGIHSASDTEHDWAWYGRMVGAYFLDHPAICEAKLKVIDTTHLSTQMLPIEWVRTDEWYNFKNLNPDVNVLITLDESSYQGGSNGAHHPIAWYHTIGDGRIFYTGLGHTLESWDEPLFRQHLLGGINYARGKENKEDWLEYDSNKFSIQYPSDWQLDTSKTMGIDVILMSELEGFQDNFRENVNVLVQDLAGTNIGLTEFATISEQQVETLITDSSIEYSMKEEGPAGEFHRVIYTGKQGIYNLKCEQYYFVKNERAYVLTFTAPVEKFDEYVEKAELIMDSFDFK